MIVHRVAAGALVAAFFAALTAAPAAARVTRIVIDEAKPVPDAESGGLASLDDAKRAFGGFAGDLPLAVFGRAAGMGTLSAATG